jgi:hypothetical protein
MTKLREKNITLSKNKCEFNKDSPLEVYVYIFSGEGISADPKKIKAIKEADIPKNGSEDLLKTSQPSQSRCEN